MRDANPIRTLEDYSKPSHGGYRNTIELPDGNNVVPFRSDTIRERTRLRLFQSALHAQASNWLERKDHKTSQQYPDVPTTLKRISLRSMYSFQRLTPKSPSSWHQPLDANPIRTLEDYSKPSHEGYKNTIELPDGNNVVPFRSDTIREGPQNFTTIS
nr:hypothetical protein [Tanacetum cinerariifolium]